MALTRKQRQKVQKKKKQQQRQQRQQQQRQQQQRQQQQRQQQQRQQRQRRTYKQRGGMAPWLPTTVWGATAGGWPVAATQVTQTAQLGPPLANGGMFTGPQSTGPWASTPFPPTQYARALETGAAFFHQRPNDNTGASFSPAFPNPPVNHKL